MKNQKAKNAIFAAVSVAATALFLYGLYALYYEYLDWTNLPIVALNALLCSVSFGALTALTGAAIAKGKKGVLKYILGFVCGAVLFNGLFWGITAVVNVDGQFNYEAVSAAITVLLAVLAVLTCLTFALIAANKNRAFGVVMAIVMFGVFTGANLVYNREDVKLLRYEKNFTFESIAAEDALVSKTEKERAEQWFVETFVNNTTNTLPFAMTLDGKVMQNNMADWTVETYSILSTEDSYAGRRRNLVTYTNQEDGIKVTVDAVLYMENATCEWTVYVKNIADTNSPVISDFYGLYNDFGIGKAKLYCTTGSHDSAEDFTMLKTGVNALPAKFAAVNGRSSDAFLPYFNLAGAHYGIVLGIGWTGQWDATIKKSASGVLCTAKQETFETYLLPEEEIRSPLISVTFYENENPLKGFNAFRAWVENCVYPENIPDRVTMMEVAGPHSVATADEIIATLDTFGDDIYEKVDNFWMDAGWYDFTEGWWDGVGSWTPDPDRYDNGIIELSDYAKNKGCGLVLWYEPERLIRGTALYNVAMQENPQWIVDVGENDRIMWNLANDDATEYLCNLIADSMLTNGVSVYRQDFNYEPLAYWQTADRDYYDGRTGIAENHYVTNLYKYLDYLLENVPGLMLDNCASGGRRLDLEMMHRGVPVWRSDYNCAPHSDILEATQTHTYALSFWMPVTGTLLYMDDEYAERTSIIPMNVTTFGHVHHENYCKYDDLRAAQTEQYYPLTGGSLDRDEMLAMQYSDYEAENGYALVYKRVDVKEKTFTLKFNGLQPDTIYTVSDYDNADFTVTATGVELMENGINIDLPDGRKAMIFMFSAK
ncbi:MAG: alpha-galactosidase [Clostridia bacterium]|nr:alpha-galactosidase [Clostridia bacterium]